VQFSYQTQRFEEKKDFSMEILLEEREVTGEEKITY
jgi:hypothetical protein